jgi:hypothetical protein
MPITNVQTQILKQHFLALHEELTKPQGPGKNAGHLHSEILSSLIYESGPHFIREIAECVALSDQSLFDCCPDDIDCICDTLDKISDIFEKALNENEVPEGSFRDLIAKLIEKLGPFLIQALIGFLLRPQPTARQKYCNMK